MLREAGTGRPECRPTSGVPGGVTLQKLPTLHKVFLLADAVLAAYVHVLLAGQPDHAGNPIFAIKN